MRILLDSMCDAISDYPTASTPKKNNTSTNNIINLDIKTLHGLPTSDSAHPPGALLHIDFSFYNVISIRGFALVLDIACASTSHSFSFPTR